ncbi:MAG TPA: phytanoyl-CoA dioxygenase, partial [Bacteroidia bacterium]|nr:phytanoyl-CoA dioxygenase [Bacteroidia bacterium]
MATAQPTIPPSSEVGSLGVMHLKRYWAKAMAKRCGTLQQGDLPEEWNTDKTLLSVLGLGLEQTTRYLYVEAPSFTEFEVWILEVNSGGLNTAQIELFNKFISSENTGFATREEPPVLTEADLTFWQENGYVIVRNAISAEDCRKTLEAVCSFLEVDINDPSTWYHAHPAKQGIMVQLFQHEMLEKNRRSTRLRRAF